MHDHHVNRYALDRHERRSAGISARQQRRRRYAALHPEYGKAVWGHVVGMNERCVELSLRAIPPTMFRRGITSKPLNRAEERELYRAQEDMHRQRRAAWGER